MEAGKLTADYAFAYALRCRGSRSEPATVQERSAGVVPLILFPFVVPLNPSNISGRGCAPMETVVFVYCPSMRRAEDLH
jgi:hypothetical protein